MLYIKQIYALNFSTHMYSKKKKEFQIMNLLGTWFPRMAGGTKLMWVQEKGLPYVWAHRDIILWSWDFIKVILTKTWKGHREVSGRGGKMWTNSPGLLAKRYVIKPNVDSDNWDPKLIDPKLIELQDHSWNSWILRVSGMILWGQKTQLNWV